MTNLLFTSAPSYNEAMNRIAFLAKVKRGVVRVAIMAIFFLLIGCKSVMASDSVASAKQEIQLMNEINALRAKNGLAPLVMDRELNDIASVRSQECSQKWSHIRPNGKHGYEMIKGRSEAGENLAYCEGSANAESTAIMFNELCNSPTHLDNMLYAGFKTVGISSYEATDGCTYVAFMFAS